MIKTPYYPLKKRYLLALGIATEAHQNQKRWGGEPYITHPVAVANTFHNVHYKIVALLHDVVKDTSESYKSLKEKGIEEQYLEAIRLLTHDDNVLYFDYIMDIIESQNKYAIAVKIADIQHNLLTAFEYRGKDKRDKYMLALHILRKEGI